jgi:hypothetical protein
MALQEQACEAYLVGLLEYANICAAIHNKRMMIKQLKMAAMMECLALLHNSKVPPIR